MEKPIAEVIRLTEDFVTTSPGCNVCSPDCIPITTECTPICTNNDPDVPDCPEDY